MGKNCKKKKYKSFYLVSVQAENDDRINRLKIDKDAINSLDEAEYLLVEESPKDIFFKQNIQSCIGIADIHIFNKNIKNNMYYELTRQILRYVALMLHPGLVTPTRYERSMQLAVNAKYNSGCLSRQVGAIVTGEDFSIKAIGWNDVPSGQIPCNLRSVNGYCTNKDCKTYSIFEQQDNTFSDTMNEINNKLKEKQNIDDIFYPFCFKEVYNGIKNDKNQVYTRALHAEENAFLQISKYGGAGIKGGKLFVTASPCELCCKKAYQLGIKEIYYIEPYPGIAQEHILDFESEDFEKPKCSLFFGAIGNGYISLYEQRLPYKDELQIITEINNKKIAKENSIDVDMENINVEKIKFKNVCICYDFSESKDNILCTVKRKETFLQEDKQTKDFYQRFEDVEGAKIKFKDKNISVSNDVPKQYQNYYHVIIENCEKNNDDEYIYEFDCEIEKREDYSQFTTNFRIDYLTEKLTINIKFSKEKYETIKKDKLRVEAYAGFHMRLQDKNAEKVIRKFNDKQYSIKLTIKPLLFYNYKVCSDIFDNENKAKYHN